MSASGAGYSGTPLPKKLGIAAGSRVLTMHAPEDLPELLAPLPSGVKVSNRLRSADVTLLFAANRRVLDASLDRAVAALEPDGALWVCWPKKASGIVSDLQSRDVLLPPLFDRHYVDVKVAAVSDVWSGLKFVLRTEYRPS